MARTHTILRSAARAALLALVVAAWLVLAALGLGPRTGSYRTLTVLSGSMDPAIPRGSVAILVPQRPESLGVGQVVTYNAPLEGAPVVTHRVLSIDEPGTHPVITTKGDANAAADPWRARVEDPVVWRARWSIPYLGYAIHALRAPLLRMLLVYAAAALGAMLWLWEVWRPRPATEAGHA